MSSIGEGKPLRPTDSCFESAFVSWQDLLPYFDNSLSRSHMSLLDANQFVIQKKILSAHEHYDFLDLQGNKLGETEGSIVQIPPKFLVKDRHEIELMHMQGKTLSFHGEFTFYSSAGEVLGDIKRKLVTFGHQEYWVEKDGREFVRIWGDFTGHEYQIEIAGQTVAAVHRKWISVRNEMGVQITGNVDRRIVIGVVIVIEHVESTQKSSSGS